MDGWREVRDLPLGLRPGQQIEMRLVGGSVASGEYHEAVLSGKVHQIDQTLYLGPMPITALSQVRPAANVGMPWHCSQGRHRRSPEGPFCERCGTGM